MSMIRRERMNRQRGTYAERAIRYRERAEELRTISDDWASVHCKGILLRLAMTYDDAASQVEKLAQSRRPPI